MWITVDRLTNAIVCYDKNIRSEKRNVYKSQRRESKKFNRVWRKKQTVAEVIQEKIKTNPVITGLMSTDKSVCAKSEIDVSGDLKSVSDDHVDMMIQDVNNEDVIPKKIEEKKELKEVSKEEKISKKLTKNKIEKKLVDVKSENLKFDNMISQLRTENEKKRKKGQIFRIFDDVLSWYNRHQKNIIIEEEALNFGLKGMTYHSRRNAIVTILADNYMNVSDEIIKKEIQEKFIIILKKFKDKDLLERKRSRNLKKIKR